MNDAPRRPACWAELEAAAAAGDPEAIRAVRARLKAEADHGKVLRVLLETQIVERGPRGPELLEHAGRWIKVDPRPQPPGEEANPERLAGRMAGCGQDHILTLGPDGWRASPMGCGVPLCPLCAHVKAARRVARYQPMIEALARSWTVGMLTFTVPPLEVLEEYPIALEERDPIPVDTQSEALPSEVGWPVPGETLRAAVERVKAALRLLRDGKHRATWRELVLGYAYGVEWTGGVDYGYAGELAGEDYEELGDHPFDECRRYRWHPHVHLLVILALPASAPDHEAASWAHELREAWADVVGGAMPAQDWTRIQPGEGLAGAVREVLKYPYKLASLTSAQLLAAAVETRRAQLHQVGGVLHGRDPRLKRARELAEHPEGLEELEALAAAGDPEALTVRALLEGLEDGASSSSGPSGWRPMTEAEEEERNTSTGRTAPVRALAGRLWIPLLLSWVRSRAAEPLEAHEPGDLAIWTRDGPLILSVAPAELLEAVRRWRPRAGDG